MSIIVSTKEGSISDTLKKYAETKAANLLNDYEHLKITSTRVILDIQKTRCIAEIIVRGKNIEAESKHESFDLYESVDTVIEKVAHQLSKHMDKIQDHHKRKCEVPEE